MTDLLFEIEQYLTAARVKPATFGMEVMGDPNFVFELRNGRDYRSKTAKKVLEHIATHPPQPEGRE